MFPHYIRQPKRHSIWHKCFDKCPWEKPLCLWWHGRFFSGGTSGNPQKWTILLSEALRDLLFILSNTMADELHGVVRLPWTVGLQEWKQHKIHQLLSRFSCFACIVNEKWGTSFNSQLKWSWFGLSLPFLSFLFVSFFFFSPIPYCFWRSILVSFVSLW